MKVGSMNDTPAIGAGERLAKVMARAGLCSRRDAEAWIRAGRVTVNGRKILTPAFNVGDKDEITVDGAPLSARAGTRLWLYHKPRGLVVTEKDPEGRPTIFAALADKGLPRFLTVGRLDINTEGLLLLTNDGGLKRVLELPSTGWLRKYRVRAHGKVTQAELDRLKEGIEVEGVSYGPIEAVLERQQGANVWLEVSLREGKNREVKNVLAPLGLEVNRLIRVSYGPFQLGELPVGDVEAVRSKVLKDQLGARLAREAGVDFDSALPEKVPPARRPGQGGPGGDRRPRPEGEARPPRGARFSNRGEDRRGARPVGRYGARAEGAGDGGRTRRIHFEDGRTESFEEKPHGRPPRATERSDAPFRKPRSAGDSAAPRSQQKDFDDRRSDSRPPRRDGDMPRRFSDGSGGARPSRRPPRDNDERPERSGPPRTRAPEAAGPRRGGARPTGAKTAGPRPARSRSAEPIPTEARPADRPSGSKQPRRPAGAPPWRPPRSAGPRPRGKGEGPPRRPRGK